MAIGFFALVSLLACMCAWAHTLFVLVPRSRCRLLRAGSGEEEEAEDGTDTNSKSVLELLLRFVSPMAEWVPAPAEAVQPTNSHPLSARLLQTAPPPSNPSFSLPVSDSQQRAKKNTKAKRIGMWAKIRRGLTPLPVPPSEAAVKACQTLLGDKRFFYADLIGICCSVVVGAMEGLEPTPGTQCGIRAAVALTATAVQCGFGLTTLVRAELALQVVNALLVVPLALIATILAFRDDDSAPSAALMQTMELLQLGSTLVLLVSMVVGILPNVLSPFCGEWETDTPQEADPPQATSGNDGIGGDIGWAMSDGLSADTGAVAILPPPHECGKDEESGEEMALLSGVPVSTAEVDPRASVREVANTRGSCTSAPDTRPPIRDPAGDVPPEEAERRQAAFEKRVAGEDYWKPLQQQYSAGH